MNQIQRLHQEPKIIITAFKKIEETLYVFTQMRSVEFIDWSSIRLGKEVSIFKYFRTPIPKYSIPTLSSSSAMPDWPTT